VTAITAQNTTGVSGILELPVALIAQQIDAVVDDIGVQAAKTGMLSSAEIIATVADAVKRHRIDLLVVDPVMVAKGGAKLLRDDAVAALRSRLLPIALVITPNLPEAEVLLGRRIESLESRRAAARELRALGPQVVIVKGGHAEGDAVDVYFDGDEMTELSSPRIESANTHGSGCAFSAAIAAGLARGLTPLDATRQAKEFITRAIEFGLEIGHGHGPVNPMFGTQPSGSRAV